MDRFVLVLLVLAVVAGIRPAGAGEADVVAVEVIETAERVYTFHVTVAHADTGWEHYADRWDVVAPDGTVLGSRVLYHPHVEEQPFRRSLSGVAIPQGITQVELRAHESQHGLGGAVMSVTLP